MSRLTRSLVYSALVAAAVGCTSDWGSSDPARLFTRFGGRVLNAETQQPLSGVKVTICDYQVSTSTDGDGHWYIEIVPGLQDTSIQITYERSGYGSVGVNWFVDVDDDTFEGAIENRHFMDVGTTSMRPGAPVTVHVTLDGAPFPAATLYAVPNAFAYDGTSQFDCTDLNIVTTTNASGVATINNLDPKEYYQVVVPTQDIDGDNLTDTSSNSTSVNISQYGSIYAINVRTVGPDPSPDITGTNLARYYDTFNDVPTGTVDGDAAVFPYGISDLAARAYNYGYSTEQVDFRNAVVTPNHSVQVVYWTPVDILQQNFRLHNNLVAIGDPDFQQDVSIPGTATALAGSNFTIWNFVPAVPLPTNENVTLNFIARSRVNPANSRNLDVDFYVPLNLPSISVAADNWNGSRDGSGGSNAVSLRFLEAVEGFYKVISYTSDGSTTTFENPYEQWIPEYGSFFPYYNYSNCSIINNEEAAPLTGSNSGQSGALPGKQFVVRIQDPNNQFVFLNDDVPLTSVNSVQVELSIRNIGGASLHTVIALAVE